MLCDKDNKKYYTTSLCSLLLTAFPLRFLVHSIGSCSKPSIHRNSSLGCWSHLCEGGSHRRVLHTKKLTSVKIHRGKPADQRRKKREFCYGVCNRCESFICLDLIVKNREVPIKKYFKWWTSTKLVWVKYQNY
jgi:hypothetical protein